ncbi:Acyl-CoA desaturase 1 [Folsomia candida]|uniref:Acyl-CoA desaturase 1 n=2 Tax=Folsomia candida TaxID=158441 RepID=A0A226DNY7_FOLCA|nr:Acyl-CoA desaturase 1 [Folsomia candida]
MGRSSETNTNINNNVVEEKRVGVVGGGRTYVCTMTGPFGMEMHHWNRIWLSTAHILGFHGWYMIALGSVPRSVLALFFPLGYFAGMGITVGCHRYWAHRTFKATFPLQVLLMYAQTMAAQYPIFKWCRDHRIHHKYTETSADPHNASRGFWFAHVGWLLERMDPAVQEKEATLDLTDLDNDPVVRFQTKYYWPLLVLSMYLVPIWIFHSVFGSLGVYELVCVNYAMYISTLHITWLVNSAAHLWGSKPYDK